MSRFGDRKKRIALAMGLASFFCAGRASMAKNNKPRESTKVSAQKGFFTNMTTGKKVGLGVGGALGAALLYEIVADTAAKNTKMPSLGKAFGWVKGKKTPDSGKKNSVPGNPDEEAMMKIESAMLKVFGDECLKMPSKKDLKCRSFAIKTFALIAHEVGIKSENLKNRKISKLDDFFIPIARKIGLSDETRFNADFIKGVACHNFDEANKNVSDPGLKLTEEEKNKLLLITNIRNMIDYKTEIGTTWDSIGSGSDFLRDLGTELESLEKNSISN